MFYITVCRLVTICETSGWLHGPVWSLHQPHSNTVPSVMGLRFVDSTNRYGRLSPYLSYGKIQSLLIIRRFHICEFTCSITCIGNPQISKTGGTFTCRADVCHLRLPCQHKVTCCLLSALTLQTSVLSKVYLVPHVLHFCAFCGEFVL